MVHFFVVGMRSLNFEELEKCEPEESLMDHIIRPVPAPYCTEWSIFNGNPGQVDFELEKSPTLHWCQKWDRVQNFPVNAVTRRQKAEVEDSMKQLMEMLSAMKASQEQMKEDMKKSQRSQEEVKSGQEELNQDMRRGQEEMKANQEELRQKLEDKLQEMKTTIEDSNTKLENKLKEFEEAVEEELNQVKEEVKEDKKEINKKIENLETKFRQLSTTTTKIKVPTYDVKVSWNTYLRQFEAVVRNWREEEKATSLIAALRGEALEVLRTIPEGSQDYKSVTSALEKRYGYAHLQHVYQAQLKNRKQRFEETLQQYEADVSRMVNLAYPIALAEVIEQLSVSSFVDGLRLATRHKTMSEALVQALEIEAAKEASRFAINPYQGRDKKMKTTDGNLIDLLLELLQQFKKGQNLGRCTPNEER
ncbi:hypothetical protein NQ315_016638 [Exocentrus adspersus]|uniref:Uncharacterized protein n=1 Tax=Exocentrus adspersus TaxID=1586481 RepID=A0AAV8VNG5_9CUCU|nr:hypothetical protein NQ315_016638 [Exocentrus adspersus]